MIFAVLFSFSVTAACSGGESQVILKLSSLANAHAETYNGVNYNTEICYDTIFGRIYSGASPHACSGSNRVARLSSLTNAHAEIPSLSNYATEVCYGNLVCTSRTSCQPGETLVVSLSSNTNAHLSANSSYPIKICCSSSSWQTGRSWADMQGNAITESEMGDTVQMVWTNTGLSPGTSVSFEIYEEDAIDDDDAIRTVDGANAITAAVNSNGNAIAYWTITQADLNKTFDFGEFVFQIQSQRSNNLEISDMASNSPPQIQIALQGQTQIFKKNTLVNFTYSAYDEDDTITLSISFGDGQTQTLTNLSGIVQHSYSSSGTKTANLTAIDSRGLSTTKYIDVFVIQQYLNIFPVISNPEEDEQLASKTVSFDASRSIVKRSLLEHLLAIDTES